MTFDNSRRIINLRIRLFIVTVIALAYLILAFGPKIIKFPFLGFSETVWTVSLSVLWVIIAFLPMALNYQYVFFSDETEKIIIRYYNAGIVGGRKNSLEIDKNTFSGYRVDTKFFGLMTSITLFQKFSEGVAKYPPVWISALSGEEKAKMLRTLNSLTTS